MRKLASIVRIESCDPIPDSDRLSVATMEGKGWRVVTGRGEFKPGDVAVYFEIDSFLPVEDTRFAFLADKCLRKFCTKTGTVLKQGYRIRTIKLRGVVSQGLLMPMHMFDELMEGYTTKPDGAVYYNYGCQDEWEGDPIGMDVTEKLKVEHYDEVAETMRPALNNAVAADSYGPFPSSYIPKTDEERIQNLGSFFSFMRGRKFEVTEKNDGASVTMFWSPTITPDDPFGVCSRNLRLKRTRANGETPVQWRMAVKYDAESAVQNVSAAHDTEYAFQGELVGPAVNGNRDGYTDWEWHVFKVYDIRKARFLLPAEARAVTKEAGFEYVPVIEEECDVFNRFTTTDDILAFAEGKTAHGYDREGLVFKSCDEPYVSFKAVSNHYLLKAERKA